jgi:hypothetical protein
MTFEAYLIVLMEPDEFAFYKRYCKRGRFNYQLAHLNDPYLADWIELLAGTYYDAGVEAGFY